MNVRNAHPCLRQRRGIGPWHWHSGSAGGTVGWGSGTRAQHKEWGFGRLNRGGGGGTVKKAETQAVHSVITRPKNWPEWEVSTVFFDGDMWM